MLQGTGSIPAGGGDLPRVAERGLAVRRFKPRNMRNGAAVIIDGGEIGRAQAVQARGEARVG